MKVLITACDDFYWRKYAKAFIASCIFHLTTVFIQVIDPSEMTLRQIDKVNEQFGALIKVSHSLPDLRSMTEIQQKVYYATARFLFGYKVLEEPKVEGGMIVDIDSILMGKPFGPTNWAPKWDEADLGIWDRSDRNLGTNEHERAGMKVIACMYASAPTRQFFKDVFVYVQDRLFQRWFLDQEAIWQVWKNRDGYKELRWFNLRDARLIDWKFAKGTSIWTGKGPRKDRNLTYMASVEEYEKLWKTYNVQNFDREEAI